MSKKLHVCIDSLNIASAKGTGIATYARNLANQLHQAEYKVSLLFDKKLNIIYAGAKGKLVAALSTVNAAPLLIGGCAAMFGLFANIDNTTDNNNKLEHKENVGSSAITSAQNNQRLANA